jgi:hypothetical protein
VSGTRATTTTVCAALVALIVLIFPAGPSFATPSTSSETLLRQTVRLGFAEIADDMPAMNACHGCPAGAGDIVSAGLRWMKSLKQVTVYTASQENAKRNAFEAFRNYGLSAVAYEGSYLDAQAGDDASAQDNYTVAVAKLKLARKYAYRAAVALRLRSYP